MDQGRGSSSSAVVAAVTAEGEVCIESLDRHRHAVHAALQARPQELCLDFTDTRLFGSDGIRLLAERAKQSADDFRLAVEVHQSLLEGTSEPHPVVELEPLLARECCARVLLRCDDAGLRGALTCLASPAPRR